MYALTPDEHFVVTIHPNDERIVVAGGFSGHGFKFAPVIGEVVSSLLVDGGTPIRYRFSIEHALRKGRAMSAVLQTRYRRRKEWAKRRSDRTAG